YFSTNISSIKESAVEMKFGKTIDPPGAIGCIQRNLCLLNVDGSFYRIEITAAGPYIAVHQLNMSGPLRSKSVGDSQTGSETNPIISGHQISVDLREIKICNNLC